jgi:hypothetical protein
VLGVSLALATIVVRSRAKPVPLESLQQPAPAASEAALMPASESPETRNTPAEAPAPPHADPALKVAHSSRPHEPNPGCHGQLHVYATHGWVIAGGPGPVQAPGRYEWPCGTYTLRAVSRVDAKETVTVTVTVRETAPGVVDLR